MPNTFSKTLDKGQRTIGIYKAQTSQGVFSGWGLSNLQQHNPTYNHYENTGNPNPNPNLRVGFKIRMQFMTSILRRYWKLIPR